MQSEADERRQDVIHIAKQLGLDFYDIRFENVPWEVMDEVAAYGLPIQAHHWSYGRFFERQRLHGRMGLSKIFEIVLNNDPVYAFLLDTNSDVENLLVTAHVAAHADFFKHNVSFADTNRQMVDEAAEHAARIDTYEMSYGEKEVERVLDIAFALERHIDPHKGRFRQPYPAREVSWVSRPVDDYADLSDEGEPVSVERRERGGHIPPAPERDLLWFLAQYAPIDDWKKDILEIIREESHYFYPQFTTKILNEGWATFWHAEIISLYDKLSPGEMIDFASLHGSVVQPGGGFTINPYYLGYKILVDVQMRYDDLYAAGESDVTGTEKLFHIRRAEDDFSFLRNYLTDDLCHELGLYTYGPACGHGEGHRDSCPHCEDIALESRHLDDVVEGLLQPRYHYGAPRIAVVEADRNRLLLRHEGTGGRTLDREFAEKTMGFIHQLWKGPVMLHTVNEKGHPLHLTVDDRGFHASVKSRR